LKSKNSFPIFLMYPQSAWKSAQTGDFDLLTDVISLDAALKVAEAFGCSSLYIPKNILAAKTHHGNRGKFRIGAAYRDLGVEYGYTESHVRSIIHKTKGGRP